VGCGLCRKCLLLDTSFSRHYTNLFPSANLTFNASDKTSYSFSFSRRIDRPQSWHLNPVQTFIDPYSSWGGNPYLLPSYTNNFEWSQSLFGGALITTFNYSHTKQSFAWAVVLDSTSLKAITQPRNLTSYENTGLSIAINLPVTKWWTTSDVYGYLNTSAVTWDTVRRITNSFPLISMQHKLLCCQKKQMLRYPEIMKRPGHMVEQSGIAW